MQCINICIGNVLYVKYDIGWRYKMKASRKDFGITRALAVSLLAVSAFGNKKAENGCNKVTALLLPGAKDGWKVTLPLSSEKCVFSVLGSDQCEPEVICLINIPGDGRNCEEDSVRITDGAAGQVALCGQGKHTYRASEGLRDLFVRVETGGAAGSVMCNAKCASPNTPRLQKNIRNKVDTRCACGFQNKDDRIVGGEDAQMAEFPWQTALVLPGTRSPFCGGTLINDKFILTAAHCFFFDNKQPHQLEVLLHALILDMTKVDGAKNVALGEEGSIRGSHYNAAKQTDSSERSLRFQVQEIINHPLFDEYYDYDYALLKLKKKINLNEADAPTPICLPPPHTYDTLMRGWAGKLFTVVGWGKSHETAGASTRMLQKVELPMQPWYVCEQKIPADVLTKRMLCAGFEEGGKDACTGDSGGGLIYQQTRRQFWQFGIVSWGEGCARAGIPGVYSRVTEGMQWINFQTMENDAKWCEGPKPLGQ